MKLGRSRSGKVALCRLHSIKTVSVSRLPSLLGQTCSWERLDLLKTQLVCSNPCSNTAQITNFDKTDGQYWPFDGFPGSALQTRLNHDNTHTNTAL